MSPDDVGPQSTTPHGLRPQALLLTFCGGHVLGRDHAVYSGSFVEVLRRVGVGEHATRSTLARMTRRELLISHRVGKRVYLGLSDEATAVLVEAATRVWRDGVVNREWDGNWTLLGFSLPESRRADRHLLRSRLTWAGFGILQHGLWISPDPADPHDLFAGLDVGEHVKAFRASTLPATDVHEMISAAWDLSALAARYRTFLARWDRPNPLLDVPDDLSRQLLLLTEWLLIVRDDPRLPAEHLPAGWPSLRAQEVARRLRDAYQQPAQAIVDEIVEHVPVVAR